MRQEVRERRISSNSENQTTLFSSKESARAALKARHAKARDPLSAFNRACDNLQIGSAEEIKITPRFPGSNT